MSVYKPWNAHSSFLLAIFMQNQFKFTFHKAPAFDKRIFFPIRRIFQLFHAKRTREQAEVREH